MLWLCKTTSRIWVGFKFILLLSCPCNCHFIHGNCLTCNCMSVVVNACLWRPHELTATAMCMTTTKGILVKLVNHGIFSVSIGVSAPTPPVRVRCPLHLRWDSLSFWGCTNNIRQSIVLPVANQAPSSTIQAGHSNLSLACSNQPKKLVPNSV